MSRFDRILSVSGIVLPIFFLALPSIWLMTTVPPLWRAIDAYVQLTYPPGPSTILLHGPLYCELARLPLWIGHLATGGSMHLAAFMKHPRLTDAGVYFLVALQHGGLWFAAFYFISGLSHSVGARVILAIFFASHPLFYGFAHCVGSESLSMIEILLLAGVGLRMVDAYPSVRMEHWLLAGLLLFCSILTRHINLVLAGLIPLTFLLFGLASRFSREELKSEVVVPSYPLKRHLQTLGAAVMLGLIPMVLASGYTHLICRKVRIEVRSRAGYTFLWRLNFLSPMSKEARRDLVERIAQRTTLPESKRFLAFLQDWLDRHEAWEPVQFLATANKGANAGTHALRDHVLNDVAAAFLFPPVSPLRAIVYEDFVKSTRLNEGDIARYMFLTTDYFSTHREQMPQAAWLVTFRRPADEVKRGQDAIYFHLWDWISFRGWFGIWLAAIALISWLGKRLVRPQLGAISYAVALAVTGILMVFLNCFFAEVLPRFVLPMMELQLLSLTLLLGCLLPHFLAGRSGNVIERRS